MIRTLIYIFFGLFAISGCLSPVSELYPEDEEERPVPVYLVRHGWHVGVAVEYDHISEYLPEHEKMPRARYLKFGWGDNRYYPDQDPGFRLLLRAALLPTRSVLHVVGIDIPIENFFAGSDIILVQVSHEGMKEISQFITDRFRKNSDGDVVYVTQGYYTNSAFFNAVGRYYVPKTSNVWTARVLRKAGAPISPFYAVTSGNVIYQTRQFGEVIRLRD